MNNSIMQLNPVINGYICDLTSKLQYQYVIKKKSDYDFIMGKIAESF